MFDGLHTTLERPFTSSCDDVQDVKRTFHVLSISDVFPRISPVAYATFKKNDDYKEQRLAQNIWQILKKRRNSFRFNRVIADRRRPSLEGARIFEILISPIDAHSLKVFVILTLP